MFTQKIREIARPAYPRFGDPSLQFHMVVEKEIIPSGILSINSVDTLRPILGAKAASGTEERLYWYDGVQVYYSRVGWSRKWLFLLTRNS